MHVPEALLREAFWTRNTDHSLFLIPALLCAPEGGMLGISDSELEAHKRLLGCLRLPEVIPPIGSNS